MATARPATGNSVISLLVVPGLGGKLSTYQHSEICCLLAISRQPKPESTVSGVGQSAAGLRRVGATTASDPEVDLDDHPSLLGVLLRPFALQLSINRLPIDRKNLSCYKNDRFYILTDD
jgi:hypothetical protein